MEKIDFVTEDKVELTGFLYNNLNINKSIIISVHGMATNCFKKRDDKIILEAQKKNIDFFSFNNRGSELVKYIKKKEELSIAGTSYEDVIDGYYDIKAAILKMKELGYEKIILLGHSLGCTKIVYTYNKLISENSELLNNVESVILLSLIDIPKAVKVYLNEKFEIYLKYAIDKVREGKWYEMMPKDAFIHPISIKTFLRYAKDNIEIDFAKFNGKDELEVLNKIQKPIFMRWGNENELILQNASELVTMLNDKIKNQTKDINYINGANHNYLNKEEVLAEEIIMFLKQI